MGIKRRLAAGICSAAIVVASYFGLYKEESKVSPVGIELIVDVEGCRTDPYYCQANKLTVGVGSTSNVIKGKKYTTEEIVVRLREDIKVAEQCLSNNVRVGMTQGEYDAYASFIFNLGCGSFRSSTLLFMLNNGRPVEACNQLSRWVYVKPSPTAKAVVSEGLKKRRTREEKVCLTELAQSSQPLSWLRYLASDGTQALYAMTLPSSTVTLNPLNYVQLPLRAQVD